MTVLVDIQRAVTRVASPSAAQIRHWAEEALTDEPDDVELVIRIVDEDEGRALNARWRKQDKATNVLSFPCQTPVKHLLGDVVICADIVEKEAAQQKKPMEAHWAHMIVHGILHLQGHDHIADDEARIMGKLERRIMDRLGFPDPYANEA